MNHRHVLVYVLPKKRRRSTSRYKQKNFHPKFVGIVFTQFKGAPFYIEISICLSKISLPEKAERKIKKKDVSRYFL